MNLNNFKVMRLDGTTYDMQEMDVLVQSLIIESPAPVHQRETFEGRSGHIDLGTDYEGRKINAKCTMIASDVSEYPTLRNEVFRIFDSREAFYLLPEESPGKRILVKCASPYSMSRLASLGEFEIGFLSERSYFESIDSSLNMSFAQISGNKSQKYKHTTPTFEILNDGDESVNPRHYPLIVSFTGASSNLQIKNLTTGDVWSYTGATAAGDVIELNGIRSTKNSLSIFRNTNRKLISLAPGWNEFELVGASGTFEITFDFRFYTL